MGTGNRGDRFDAAGRQTDQIRSTRLGGTNGETQSVVGHVRRRHIDRSVGRHLSSSARSVLDADTGNPTRFAAVQSDRVERSVRFDRCWCASAATASAAVTAVNHFRSGTDAAGTAAVTGTAGRHGTTFSTTTATERCHAGLFTDHSVSRSSRTATTASSASAAGTTNANVTEYSDWRHTNSAAQRIGRTTASATHHRTTVRLSSGTSTATSSRSRSIATTPDTAQHDATVVKCHRTSVATVRTERQPMGLRTTDLLSLSSRHFGTAALVESAAERIASV
jgi:hypothetical protein